MRVALVGLALALLASPGAGSEDVADALRQGAAAGDLERVRELLAPGGVDPDAPDAGGRTALMHAAAAGHEEIVGVLLEAGAAVDRGDATGQTALHLAVRNGQPRTARLLLQSGADEQRRDAEGRTPLYRAIQEREEEIIEMLQAVALARGGGPRSGAPGGARGMAIPPRIVESTPAAYTETARAAGVEGRVVLIVLVRRDGSVGASSVKEKLEDSLDASAQRAVQDWKFAPAMRDGRSVEMLVEVEVRFDLPDEP